MTVPSSGELSLGKIRQELETGNYSGGPYTTNQTNLSSGETGSYATINTSSPSYPDGIAPYAMSEWYSYDQNFTPGPMPTITGYTATPADNLITGITSVSRPAVSYVKLTNTRAIGIAIPNDAGTCSVYANGIEWTSSTPTVNNYNLVSTNGYVRSGRNTGIALAPLTSEKAVAFYQNGTSSTRIQILKYIGGSNSVSVEATTTISGDGGYSSGRAIRFATSGSTHYIALSSNNPSTGNFDSYVKIYKVDDSTDTVTYITQGQIHTGADNSADVISFGEVSTNTYGLLGTSRRNTTFNGALAYATMKFNISTETLTVSSNLNTLQASAVAPEFTSVSGVNIADDEVILYYRRPGVNAYQATINYNGTTTTVENNTTYGGGSTYVPRAITQYLLDGYTTPENQIILGEVPNTSTGQALNIDTVVYNPATHQWASQSDTTQIEVTTSTSNGSGGSFPLIFGTDKGLLVWADNGTDNFKYNTFTINT